MAGRPDGTARGKKLSAAESWHLDRRIPIAIIVTLAVQLTGFGYMIGHLHSRVNALELWRAEFRAERADVPRQIATLEAKVDENGRSLARIERTLEALQRGSH